MDIGTREGLPVPIRVPPAIIRCLDWQSCLCHFPSLGQSEELTKISKRSWESLLNAANVRLDDTYEFPVKEGVEATDDPRGVFHRSCYQNYTNRTNLARLLKKREKEGNEAGQLMHVSSNTAGDDSTICSEPTTSCAANKRVTRKSQACQTDFKLCILCQKIKMEDKHRKEKIGRVEMDCAVATLLHAANVRGHERVLLATEYGKLDFFAAEVRYHPSCYRIYTNKKTLALIEQKQAVCTWDRSGDHTGNCNRALQNVLEFVDRVVVREHHILSVVQVDGKFRELLEETGELEHAFRREKLKGHIAAHFGDAIDFHKLHAASRSELLFSATITKHQLIEAYVQLYEQSHCDENIDYEDVAECHDEDQFSCVMGTDTDLQQCALRIRSDVMSARSDITWPPRPERLTIAAAERIIPVSLYNWLVLVFLGESCLFDIDSGTGRINGVPSKVKNKVMAISQDVNTAQRGRIVTPKHILLSSAVHHLTRSAQLVTLLNNFGHGVSLSQLQELNTALAEVQVDLVGAGNVPIPSNIDSSLTVVVATDNNDLLEDTATGSNTTHCTNTILVQRAVPHVAPEPIHQADRSRPRSHRRSLQLATDEPPPPAYIASKRCGPGQYLSDMSTIPAIDSANQANVKCTDVCQCSSNCSNQPEPVAQAPGGYEEVDTDSADEEM